MALDVVESLGKKGKISYLWQKMLTSGNSRGKKEKATMAVCFFVG
jgi:hypothetical protein